MAQEDRRVLRAHKVFRAQQVPLWVHTARGVHKVPKGLRDGKEQQETMVLMAQEGHKVLQAHKVGRE